MSKLFTDENGNKYELVKNSGGLSKVGDYIIRPARKKWKVWIEESSIDNYLIQTSVNDTSIKQAQAIKDCYEELMRVILAYPFGEIGMETEGDLNAFPPTKLINEIISARTAIGSE